MKSNQFPPTVRQGPDASVLDEVVGAETRMALWRRTLPLCLTAWIDSLSQHHLPHGRVLVNVPRIAAAISRLFDTAGTPAHRLRDWLIADAAGLAQRYAALHGLTAVDIRLEAVDGDACWKFHRDQVALRLLTTYRGPGTEWVAPDIADAALAAQRAFTGPIHRMSRGTVALMKGSGRGADAGILHRSPPLDGSGVTRLLLAVNAPSDASPDPCD